MSFSTSLKFILDENVRTELKGFLISKGCDVLLAPKGISNGKLASLSKSERGVLVTNDADFNDPLIYPKEKLFSVILLKIPQDKPDALLRAFSLLIKSKSKLDDFEGHLIFLKEDSFEMYPLFSSLTK